MIGVVVWLIIVVRIVFIVRMHNNEEAKKSIGCQENNPKIQYTGRFLKSIARYIHEHFTPTSKRHSKQQMKR